AIDHVNVTVAIGMDQNFTRLSVDRKVEKNVLVDRIVVVEIVRAELVIPDGFAANDIAGEYAGGEFIIAGTSVRIPGAGIGRPVINKAEFRIIRDPSPSATTANFPCIRRPTFYAEVLAAILRIKRLESRTNQHVSIRSGCKTSPCNVAGFGIESFQPAAHAEF